MFDLTGKVALVTGASSGIGRAIAIALAGQGANVVVAARRTDRLDELVKQLSAEGKGAHAVRCDVTNKDDISSAVAETVKRFGRLDILVNNAGVAAMSPILSMTDEVWEKTLTTNLTSYAFMVKAAVPEMQKAGGGRIINIASVASGAIGMGFANASNYCASKGGIIGFTEATARELAPLRITVNAIGPGLIDTEMTSNIKADKASLTGMLAAIPLGRMGTPEEIAAAAVYLASNEASYTTGATFYIDGGWTA